MFNNFLHLNKEKIEVIIIGSKAQRKDILLGIICVLVITNVMFLNYASVDPGV